MSNIFIVARFKQLLAESAYNFFDVSNFIEMIQNIVPMGLVIFLSPSLALSLSHPLPIFLSHPDLIFALENLIAFCYPFELNPAPKLILILSTVSQNAFF